MAESVDAADLKSVVLCGRGGSSPLAGTNLCLKMAYAEKRLKVKGVRLTSFYIAIPIVNEVRYFLPT